MRSPHSREPVGREEEHLLDRRGPDEARRRFPSAAEKGLLKIICGTDTLGVGIKMLKFE